MWRCPWCAEVEPLEMQVGHLRWCPAKKKEQEEAEEAKAVIELPLPVYDPEDLDY